MHTRAAFVGLKAKANLRFSLHDKVASFCDPSGFIIESSCYPALFFCVDNLWCLKITFETSTYYVHKLRSVLVRRKMHQDMRYVLTFPRKLSLRATFIFSFLVTSSLPSSPVIIIEFIRIRAFSRSNLIWWLKLSHTVVNLLRWEKEKKSSNFLLFASHLRSFAGGKHSFRFYSQLDWEKNHSYFLYIFFFLLRNVRKYFPHIYFSSISATSWASSVEISMQR